MTRRILIGVAWALAGLAIAGGLMAGAFALAGGEISRPATPVVVPREPPHHDTDDRSRTPDATRSPSASPSPDDHGGASPSPADHGGTSPSPADHGASDDHGGSGADGDD